MGCSYTNFYRVYSLVQLTTSASALGGEEEPIHKDAGTVFVRVVSQKPILLVLLASAVTLASIKYTIRGN